MAGYSAVKPTLAKLAKFRQIRHRQCCGKTLSKLPNLPLRAFLDISEFRSVSIARISSRGILKDIVNHFRIKCKKNYDLFVCAKPIY